MKIQRILLGVVLSIGVINIDAMEEERDNLLREIIMLKNDFDGQEIQVGKLKKYIDEALEKGEIESAKGYLDSLARAVVELQIKLIRINELNTGLSINNEDEWEEFREREKVLNRLTNLVDRLKETIANLPPEKVTNVPSAKPRKVRSSGCLDLNEIEKLENSIESRLRAFDTVRGAAGKTETLLRLEKDFVELESGINTLPSKLKLEHEKLKARFDREIRGKRDALASQYAREKEDLVARQKYIKEQEEFNKKMSTKKLLNYLINLRDSLVDLKNAL